MALSDIVNINVTAQTKFPSRVGYGTPLCAAYHAEWAERVRSYTSVAAAVADGFVAGTPVYNMLSAIFSQNPSPTRAKVGRRALAYTKSWDLTPTDTTEGLVYTVTITDGTTVESASYTVAALDAVADICDGLTTALGAISAALTPTDNTTKVTLAADNAGDMFGISVNTTKLLVDDVTADPGIATDLADIAAEDNDWYGLVLDSGSAAEITAADAWVEANRKLFGAQSQDGDVLTSATTDIASVAKASSLSRTFVGWHGNNQQYMTAAMFGKNLPYDPGTVDWIYKELNGITVDSLTDTESGYCEAKYATYYTEQSSLNLTRVCKTADGNNIDIIQIIDWTQSEMQAAVLGVLASNKKVEFTDSGIQAVIGAIKTVVAVGESRGAFVPGTAVISFPGLDAVAPADRAANHLKDINLSIQISGSIRKVTANVTLTI